MKSKHLLKITALLIFAFIMQSCHKAKPCTTCTATYGGSTVANEQTCGSDAEESFRTTYYYAETSCK